MSTRDPERDLAAIALLTDPTRRALYEYVSSKQEFVGRDEVASEVGIARGLAAFHLDRLAAAGMLETRFARLSGRRGPGAGRTAKLYRRARRDFEVSVPVRDYALPATVLSRVVAASPSASQDAMDRAHDVGLELGRESRRRAGRPRTRAALRRALQSALQDRGFEPQPDGADGLQLRNCPFDALAKEQTDLVCGMNHALVRGLLEGLEADGIEAMLDPAANRCCVRLSWRTRGPATD